MRFDDLRHADEADRDEDAETLEDIVRYRSELGLSVDPETTAYFLAEYKAERHDGGMWLTEAEEDEQDRIAGLIAEARDRVDPYVNRHRADFAGRWQGYGHAEYHVGFARNFEAHRQALAKLVPNPGVLHVHDFEFTEAELKSISDLIAKDADELAAEGLTWMGSGIDEPANRVEVEVAAPSAAMAEAALARRYGRAVRCTWRGTKDYTLEEVPWQLWTLDDSGRLLTVHYTTFRGYELDHAECREEAREVRITVVVRAPSSVRAIGASFEATVELAAPLGGRRVVDGATGRERERRVPKEVFDRSRELIHAYAAEHPAGYGGSWAEHPGCHVAFTSGVDAHREALLELLPEPRVLVMHEVERTAAELEALQGRIKRERRDLRRHGIRCSEPYVWIDDNVVFVEVEAKDEDAARRFLADRYGPGVHVMWGSP